MAIWGIDHTGTRAETGLLLLRYPGLTKEVTVEGVKSHQTQVLYCAGSDGIKDGASFILSNSADGSSI